MKFFLRETESWSAVNKSKLHKTEKVSVIIEPSDNRYNSDLVCMVLEQMPRKKVLQKQNKTFEIFDEKLKN